MHRFPLQFDGMVCVIAAEESKVDTAVAAEKGYPKLPSLLKLAVLKQLGLWLAVVVLMGEQEMFLNP
jgi:hypothetical protein